MAQTPSQPPPHDLAPEFEALVRAHYGRLFGVAYSYLRTADAAEDAVQGALLKVWRQGIAPRLDDPVAYLFRAVRNQCIMALRRRRRWDDVELDDAASPSRDPAASPTDRLEAEELGTAIKLAIAELPERCRLIFLLSREQELSYREIADTLGISPKTVEAQMGKALRHLRHRLAGFLSIALTTLSAAALTHRG